MNEAETRAKHIDPALNAAGWGVKEGSRRTAIFSGPKFYTVSRPDHRTHRSQGNQPSGR